jgi:hypothetical protein
VGANYSAYWGRTLEEGIKKRLGAFRPDFPVAAGQQVSLIRYASDAGTVFLYGWVGANYSAYWGQNLGEGIKKRLCAFRPDFPLPDRLVYYGMPPGCKDGLYSWVGATVGANSGAYWGRTLEEGIKKRLGAFRPDFPVAAGQQVSLIWYVPDPGTVCTAGWEPTTSPSGAEGIKTQEAAGCFQT